MKFFKAHSSDILRLFVTQLGMTVFGLVLTFAAAMKDPTLKSAFPLLLSIFAACFYLYLIYTMTWDIGLKDKVRIEAGRQKQNDLHGAALMLWAQIPNLVVALLLWISAIGHLAGGPFMLGMGDLFYGVALPVAWFGQAMYLGIIMQFFSKTAYLLNAVIFTVSTLPALFTATMGYFLGVRDIRFLTSPQKPPKN